LVDEDAVVNNKCRRLTRSTQRTQISAKAADTAKFLTAVVKFLLKNSFLYLYCDPHHHQNRLISCCQSRFPPSENYR